MITDSDISSLSLDEKLSLMELLWKEISKSERAVEVPQWHKDLLASREAKVRKGEAHFVSWEEAKKQIEERCR